MFEHTAYRLETLDAYQDGSEAEAFGEFTEGVTPSTGWLDEWRDMVAAATAAGKRIERVHIVTEPLTDYLQFELGCAYPASVEAGSDIRILPRRLAAELGLAGARDYWLLDSAVGLSMRYDQDGRVTGVRTTRLPWTIARYCRQRDVAMHYATPLADYLSHADIAA